VALVSPEQHRHEGTDAEIDAAPADVECPLPVLTRIGEQAASATDAGIVEQQMDFVGRLLSASSSRKRLSWSSIETSAMWAVTRRPCGSFSASQSRLVSAIASMETSHIATLQPSATSWRANSRPMPVPPPVITANFPTKSFIAATDLSAMECLRLRPSG
jgi:hypothetical protein